MGRVQSTTPLLKKGVTTMVQTLNLLSATRNAMVELAAGTGNLPEYQDEAKFVVWIVRFPAEPEEVEEGQEEPVVTGLVDPHIVLRGKDGKEAIVWLATADFVTGVREYQTDETDQNPLHGLDTKQPGIPAARLEKVLERAVWALRASEGAQVERSEEGDSWDEMELFSTEMLDTLEEGSAAHFRCT
jgi:hypothetical protein